MKNRVIILAGVIYFLLLRNSDGAFVDFRNAPFDDCTLSPVTSCTRTVGGVQITVEGWEDSNNDNVFDPLVDTPATLWWDNIDGFGIQSNAGYEPDEIDGPEFLVVKFNLRQILSQLSFTDLFYEGPAGSEYQEQGYYRLTVGGIDGPSVQFLADLSQVPGTTNGVLNLAINNEQADQITFTAPGIVGSQTHEYALAGVDVAPDFARLINISTRSYVGTVNDVAIGGFVVGGTLSKQILIRARGSSLATFGVPGPLLPNPIVELYADTDHNPSTPQVKIAQNDDWQDPPQCEPGYSCGPPNQIQATGLDPCSVTPLNCSLDSAILITVPPGTYTAILSGVGGTTGVGIVEVFDPDTTTLPKLVNISTRALVLTGDSVEIGGFLIKGGTAKKTVLIRARGSSLTDFNVPGPLLPNPTMQLYSGQTMFAQNNDWQTTDPLCGSPAFSCGNAQDINDTGLDPCDVTPTNCGLDSAILVTLPPNGNPPLAARYTAIVSGVGGTTGKGIVEVFDLPNLTVTKAGSGTGTVSSNPAGINCGTDCTQAYHYNGTTIVNLTATPNGGSVFGGWSGDPDCADGTVTMDTDKTCTATFN